MSTTPTTEPTPAGADIIDLRPAESAPSQLLAEGPAFARMVGFAGLFGLTVWAFDAAPKGFIPQQDQGRLIVNVQLPDAASLERTQAAVEQIDRMSAEERTFAGGLHRVLAAASGPAQRAVHALGLPGQ